MKSLRILLPILILTASTFSQIRTKESSVTIKVQDGKFLVSGLVSRDLTTQELVISKIKAVLPQEGLVVDVKADYGIRPFSSGWKKRFETALLNVKEWKYGIYIFSNDRNKENRDATNYLVQSLYLPIGTSKSERLIEPGKKATLIVLFATWCGPCRYEIPFLNDLHTKFGNQGLEIIALDVDNEKESDIQSFAARTEIKFKIGKTSDETQDKIVALTNFPGIPQILRFSGSGILQITRGASPSSLEELKAQVSQLFDGKE